VSEPLFKVIPLLPCFLFRSGLVDIVVPMLPACVGLVAHIKALLCRPTPVASRARVVNPTSRVGSQRPSFVFPSGNGVAVLVVVFHLVVLPCGHQILITPLDSLPGIALPGLQKKLDGSAHHAEQ